MMTAGLIWIALISAWLARDYLLYIPKLGHASSPGSQCASRPTLCSGTAHFETPAFLA
jgi:hypothetical protein